MDTPVKQDCKALPGIAYSVIAGTVKLLRRTWRVRIDDPADFRRTETPWPVVIVLWHNRLLFAPTALTGSILKRLAFLASLSKDGEHATRFLNRFGAHPIRGSTSRGGRRALFAMKRAVDNGYSMAITLDGPRGPRYSAHPGAAILAEMTGASILPLAVNAQKRWELDGWDRTQIPKPFTRVTFRFGEPIHLQRGMSAEERQEAVECVRRRLLDITED